MEKYYKLIAALLELSSKYFDGDFNLVSLIPDVNDRRELVKAMYAWNGDPENFDPNGNYEVMPDYWLMGFFAGKLKEIT